MQSLGARYVLTAAKGSREVAARDYYESAFVTKLAPGEMLTAIRFPVPPAGHGWAYEKLKRKVGDYAIAAAAIMVEISGGKCKTADIALTNVGPTPLFAEKAGKALIGSGLDKTAIDAAVKAAIDVADPSADIRGPVEYRKSVLGVMVRRGIEAAKSRAH